MRRKNHFLYKILVVFYSIMFFINNDGFCTETEFDVNSKYLPVESVVNDVVAVRLAAPLVDGSTLLLGIPGGPGISGQYMDGLLASLGRHLNLNAGVIDLPMHGKSKRLFLSGGPLVYSEVKTIIYGVLETLYKRNIRIVLVGHSLGAFIALDLNASSQSDSALISSSVLVSMPVSFDGSPVFSKKLKEIGADEERWVSESSFELWWKRVLPLYFYSDNSLTIDPKLMSPTFWIGNEQFLEGIPSLAQIKDRIPGDFFLSRVIFLQGDNDIVLPADNFNKIKAAFPAVRSVKIKNSGHFPMYEKADELVFGIEKFLVRKLSN